MSSYAKSLKFFAGFSAIYLAAVACINLWLDPFGLRNHGGRLSHARLVKAIQVNRLNPDVVFVGSSSVAIGLNPEHEVFQDYKSVYNLGIFGANFYELGHYFRHAAHGDNLEKAFIALDFYGFNKFMEVKPGFSESRLNSRRMHPRDFLELYFSLEALTLIRDANVEENYFASNGLLPKLQNWNIQDREELFAKHLQQNILEEGGMYYGDYALSEKAFQELAHVVSLAQKENIDIQFFLPAPHATLFHYVLDTPEYWTIYKEWLRKIVKIYPVWDFSGCNRITTKSVDSSEEYYEDPLHFTPKVGSLMIERVYARESSELLPKFGIYVTPDNVDSHLKEVEKQCDRWKQENPKTIAWLESLNLKPALISSRQE
ncbi:hypothetical protein XM38_013680 [Halomicronema hongdechloris C2206]|uniref:Uncharacterized protein n=1 Tax=Halomicronema hongdechloris C2206 TaxID=1641165 RepID=A0A1Z3HJD9_9CYAN|nr:hypothetical protein [Halomicronema hongdechloris]ASC70429.1 hypothetical protein XM38_013680 [Halomicronema hongdechloris C2206]